MPLIELTTTPDTLPMGEHAGLADALTAAFLKARDIPDTPRARLHVWMFVHRSQAYVGGALHTDPLVMVEFTYLEGGMRPQRVPALITDATNAIHDVAPKARVWVTTREVPDGQWGDDGKPMYLTEAKALMGVT